MKLRKTFVSAFIVTFFIGYVSVLPTLKVGQNLGNIEPPVVEIQLPSTRSKDEIIGDAEPIINEEGDVSIQVDNYPFKIKLLETGDGFHGDEVKARNGETWLGLFEEKDGFYLRQTKLEVKRVDDPIYDYKMSGKSVDVSAQKQPIFLLKNATKLKTGKILTLEKGLLWEEFLENYKESEVSSDEVLTNLTENFQQYYEIGKEKFALRVIKAKNKGGESILALVLENKMQRQILHTMNVDYNPSVGTLYWVGDLDRDAKPDFYLELFVHENVDYKVLYLSSEAEKGKLVKKVAYFWTTGC
jgi:hypothetical protein